MTLRFPEHGNRPSWLEVLILFALAAAAFLVIRWCFLDSAEGRTHPVLADQVARVQPTE